MSAGEPYTICLSFISRAINEDIQQISLRALGVLKKSEEGSPLYVSIFTNPS